MDSLPSALLWCRKGKVRLPFALCQNVLDMTRLFQLRFSERKGGDRKRQQSGAINTLLCVTMETRRP